MKSILILSLWNPTPKAPTKGIFIHDQVEAICQTRSDVMFLEINILPSSKIFRKTITEKELGLSNKIVINFYSIFWKIIFLNPWFICYFTKNYLKKNHKDFIPSLIHSNIVFPCAIIGGLLAKEFNANHVISEHWSNAEKLLKHPIYGKFVLKTYQNSKAILCVSNFLANKIKLATHHPNTVIIPNIINTELFYFTHKQSNKNEFHFTCCAIWKAPKRLDLIINSLVKFASETNKNLELNVIGEGIQKESFRTTKLPKNLIINWLGQIPKPEIAKILYHTDIFLHASEIETFSIVTAEALSTGTPVLASKTGALPELINPSNGILVNNDIDSWIKGFHEMTEKTYNNLAIAFEVSNKYSPKSVAQSIEKVYESILNNQ